MESNLKPYAKVGGHSPQVDKIKNDVAKENGYKGWTDLLLQSINSGSRVLLENCWQEVAIRCLNIKK